MNYTTLSETDAAFPRCRSFLSELNPNPVAHLLWSLFAQSNQGLLVEQMLALHKQSAAAQTPQEHTALARQIAATDTQIDRLVYDLYGLTDDEIHIVEGKA